MKIPNFTITIKWKFSNVNNRNNKYIYHVLNQLQNLNKTTIKSGKIANLSFFVKPSAYLAISVEEGHLSWPKTWPAIVKTLFIDTRVKDRRGIARILAI